MFVCTKSISKCFVLSFFTPTIETKKGSQSTNKFRSQLFQTITGDRKYFIAAFFLISKNQTIS